MHRREFIKHTSLTVGCITVLGSIRITGSGFVGDDVTTSDILGPFYRPGAPLRNQLNPHNYDAVVLHLTGTVFGADHKLPLQDCLIEIWQCGPDGFYDNSSDAFIYRGSAKTSADGTYHFITAQPPPEPTDEAKTVYRPAHIHLRISATGHQDLITQIYFKGDALLPSDPSTNSPLAINRILEVRKLNSKESEIRFDVVLPTEFPFDAAIFQQVCGVYKMNNGSLMAFYRDGDLLFYKINGQIWGGLSYDGNHRFTGMNTEVTFKVTEESRQTVSYQFLRRRETRLQGEKLWCQGFKH